MSMHCPQCGGLVYARSNPKCGHCGASLPAEFGFTDAELAEEAARIRNLNRLRKPQMPVIPIACWFVAAVGSGILTATTHRWIYGILAVTWVGAIIERVLRYLKEMRRFKAQNLSS